MREQNSEMPDVLPRNRSIPPTAVLPVLLYPNVVEAAAWLCRAFAFAEHLRIGTHRVQMATPGGHGFIVVAEGGSTVAPSGSSVMVRIDNVDEHHQMALAAGAEVLRAP